MSRIHTYIGISCVIYMPVDLKTCICTEADPGFQVRGGALIKIAPSGGRRENCWGISCEKSRFYAKKSYFSNFRGGRAGCALLDPPLLYSLCFSCSFCVHSKYNFIYLWCKKKPNGWVMVMVFNATFDNISDIWWLKTTTTIKHTNKQTKTNGYMSQCRAVCI